MLEQKPKLRQDLQIIPSTVQGRQVFVVHDSLGLIKSPVVLNRETAGLLGMLDGANTVQDIELALVRRRGGLLGPGNEAEKILEQFDAHFLLDNEHSRSARRKIIDEFAKQDVRRPSMAGQSYPDEPEELRKHLDGILAQGTAGDATPASRIVALVAPHIDLNVGQKTYAAAYQRIRAAKPDLVVIVGTGHAMENHVFCLTGKDFQSPLGTVKTDRQIVEDLRAVGGKSVAGDDFAHRTEHSIELQLIFLQHVLVGHAFRIVPILCGSFRSYLKDFSRPADLPDVKGILSALKRVVESENKNVLVVASADLSHVGPKFGDDRPAKAIMPDAGEHDQALLKALCEQDVEAFWAESRRVEDRYHVCGFSVLACLMEILPRCSGRVLSFDTWHEDPTMSAVSFAALEII